MLDANAWVAPQGSVEAEAVITAEGLTFDEFRAEFAGDSRDLVDRLYDLRGLAAAYDEWLLLAHEIVDGAGETDDRTAFATRSRLLHEWRKFLFRDPGLPPALVPEAWPGAEARRYFDVQAARLLPGARTYVDRCLERRSS
jgi:phenylacetic acid degradation operon negative regulatory protein